jgi:hypothetical protein
MKISRTQKHRLSYVVPGYVWQQGDFKFSIDEALPVIEAGRGIIVVDSQSVPRREYVASAILAEIQKRDYHADIGWTSFFPREESEFTSAVKLPKHKEIQVIAVKTELTPEQVDQMQDLIVSCKIAIVASHRLQLYVPHRTVIVRANESAIMSVI